MAGNGTLGSSGDGGPATAAQLAFPFDVALDATSNLYIVDGGNRIRKVGTSGTITTVAGDGTFGYSGDGGPATSAQLNNPTGEALDASGNLYIADTSDNRVRKVDPSGTIATVAGDGTGGYGGDGGPATSAQLGFPIDVALDAAGNLYIADFFNQVIRKVDTSGTITTVAGDSTLGYSGDGGPAIAAQLAYPRGVALNAAGDLYIADLGNSRVRRVAPAADTTAPVLSLPGTITANATSAAGAVVSYTVSATDPDNAPNQLTISCAPPSGSTFAIGTTTVNCSAHDPANNTATGSFQVVVQGAATQIGALTNLVNSFGLPSGLQGSLDGYLQTAQAKVNAGNISAACGNMTQFIGLVNAQSGKKLTTSQAQQLLAGANTIMAVLGC